MSELTIFDSHTHINDPAFTTDLPDVIKRAHAWGVKKMLVLAGDEASFGRLQQLWQIDNNIYGAAGCHPEDAVRFNTTELDELAQKFKFPQMKALGEIGLDYHCSVEPKIQQEVFQQQLELARELNVPVSIHNRDAFEDTYRILKAAHVGDFGAIMHSFNGDTSWSKKFLDLGMNLSFSGVVTFKNAVEVREAFLATPLDRILVETDAPYLAPVPYRGQQNEPGFTRLTVEYLADLRQLPVEKFAKQTYQNTLKILRI
ncbi:MAG: TatD family hydrolase [Liquorilactobacillus nagelii]|jgi:TatD DNase family protein|uniref:TatD family hydrolase n=1 Tax=Liquorilactobacillus nagelii TaxID=82688 RepID=UPI00242FFECD|nr:TatD family hydrolase [Liquorilactobacillus nagelii]MCI1633404.1 TatD family hydrolase [Liquorilactobacillus nagelii]MCI1922217.1 TatD family hydrolase [Liquorilactobacillus nagelii]MCI1977892.1 TatD family hydrolase [Liquorilactobacillus nagelii]